MPATCITDWCTEAFEDKLSCLRTSQSALAILITAPTQPLTPHAGGG